MNSYIKAIDRYLPERVLDNAALERLFPEWPAAKVLDKTGIERRHVAADGEATSDLATAAGRRLLDRPGLGVPAADIDYLLLCTQTPDYLLPTTACLVQDRLGLPTACGALDLNLGCSGYVYGLGLATGLVASGQARNVLLITADTYTKLLNPRDRAVRTLFGDGAAATLVAADDGPPAGPPGVGAFVTGTDGRGWKSLVVPRGGMRCRPLAPDADPAAPRTDNDLFMDGPEIFAFAGRVVPPLVDRVLAKAGLGMADIGLFVFHQANEFMLNHLRRTIGIPPDKMYVNLRNYGNTVSSTIPLALSDAAAEGRLRPGDRVALIGFGVGLSWAGCVLTWR